MSVRAASVGPVAPGASVTALPIRPQSDISQIPSSVQRLRATFDSGRTRPAAWRREQLGRLRNLLQQEEGRIFDALKADLGKGQFEAFAGEIGQVLGEIDHMLKKFGRWMKPERVGTPAAFLPGRSYVIREPLGVVLVIAPWNYPLQLSLSPVVGALAAGNCVLLKPSEVAPATSRLMAELLPRYLDSEAVAVVEGGVEETTALLKQRWDHIFYTGNGQVGRIVMRAAAEHLTPVTLELGGKSPTIIDTDIDLDLAARRVAWGKYFNAGQTCTAPDYVLVLGGREQAFIDALGKTLSEFYGPDPQQSPDYPRIVSDRHVRRLEGLLADGEVVIGGKVDVADRYIAPTVLRRVPHDSRLMNEEIFGPLLPVLPMADINAAVAFIKERPKPLALYLFSQSSERQRFVLGATSSGGACINDVVSHVGVGTLPFGGVGESGQGAYHGRHSFETFSHRKAVYNRATWLDVRLRYAPYGDRLKIVRKLL